MNTVQQGSAMGKRFQRDREEKINSILRSFTTLVNRVGYDKVTIRQIANESEISVGIIYYYFPEGKPAIAARLYEENFLGTIAPDLTVEESPERLRQRIRSHLQAHREDMELYRAFDQAALSNQDLFQNLKRSRRDLLEAQSIMKQFSPNLVEAWLTSYTVIDALIHRHLFVEKIRETDEELVEWIANLLTTGLAH